ncbi:hypothetical protein D4764_04G0011670 [Takifugu flavidus]|uniref:Uncharacterized protein n=1 Tax=Takifugu flavidus TaxID=433684 RepID=A0A5C6N9J2_9TELE|nr:hypothetical protein D4764_04G0011670 [Takifugu flavidus]
MKKKQKNVTVIQQKMALTFSLRRREVVECQPMVSEVQGGWPALFSSEEQGGWGCVEPRVGGAEVGGAKVVVEPWEVSGAEGGVWKWVEPRLQKMGCSCSTSSDEWSDSDSDSSLPELPPFVRRSTKTVELRQHTSAGTQQACLDEEVKGDGRGTCDQQRPTVDPEPQCDNKDGEEVRVETTDPHQAFKTKTHSCYSIRPIDADDLEQEQNQCPTDEPGPSTVLQTSLLPPPIEPETSLLPPPPEPVTGLLPPPEPDTGLLPPPPEPETGLLPPPPGPETGLLPTPPPELSLSSEVNVRLTTGSSTHIGQQTRRGSTKSKIDWQDNVELQHPWLPVNSRVRRIPSREEGDGPSVLICFYNTLEDLGPPRPECQDVGTQTLPPGAGGDAPTPSSKIHSVCPERRVMAEGGNSGDKPKATVWSQGTPQAGFPQRGGGVDIPGPVLEPRPSKNIQNIQPMLNRGLEQRSKTKADHQPAHSPGQQVGSKLTYAQVLMMPPRKRAPPPDLSPPYPEQEHQPAGTRRPLKLRYGALWIFGF